MGNENLENWMENKVGVLETPRLVAKECKVVMLEKVVVNKRDKSGTIDKIVFELKHPDRAESIDTSDVQYIDGKEVKQKCLWYFTDTNFAIQKGSALAVLLSFYGVVTLKEMIGKQVKTAVDEKGYICLKAY